MPVYEYRALDKKGKEQKGVIIDAESESSAKSRLRSSGMYPVELKKSTSKSRGPSVRGSGISFFNTVKSEDINVITRQLATLLGAGIPLVQALSSLIEQLDHPLLRSIIAQIRESVNEGATFSQALSNHRKQFSTVYINMVWAGEASGSLAVVMERLAEFGEKQQMLKSRMRAALVYPIFMGVIGSAILFILITYIVPNISQVFEEMDRVLPLPTRVLIGLSDFLRNYWWLVGIVFAGLFLSIRFFLRTRAGRFWWDSVKLKIVIFGGVNRKIILARFASTLGSLLSSGVPLVSSMEIVKALINNRLIAEVLNDAAADIEKGKSMTAALKASPWFPPMFVQMVTVGEQSGELEKMLDKVSLAYDRDVEAAIMGMTALIEPVMIAGMGLVVGFIVLSILLPIFEMNQMIG